MKKILSFLAIVIITSFMFFISNIYPQVVTGKLIEENNNGLAEVSLELYISPNVYNTNSLSDGSFSFNLVTSIEEEGQLPSGYSITNNFPNPFNPKTRIGITLPTEGKVRIGVYNILGQRVIDEIDRNFSAGTHSLDIELEGLASGVYIAHISIDEKYNLVKKMMLIYASQHLSSTAGTFNNQLHKSNSNSFLLTEIDSLVATSLIIGRKTFTELPGIVGDTLDLGELTIERYCPGLPTVLYEGKTYNTVLIGTQCWLQQNLDVGTMINSTSSGGFQQTNNGILEKYCYENNPANCETYGGLYEWPEAMQYSTTPGVQGICPPGWHIPTLAEFQTLSTSVGGDGNALRAVGQGTGGGAGTNTSGFSALFAGYHYYYGTFSDLGLSTFFWSSTEYDATHAYFLGLGYSNSGILLYDFNKEGGFSVRCLKD